MLAAVLCSAPESGKVILNLFSLHMIEKKNDGACTCVACVVFAFRESYFIESVSHLVAGLLGTQNNAVQRLK